MKASDRLIDLPLFYINLDTREDRRADIEKEISRVGWKGPVTRVPGTVLNINSDEFKQYRLERIKGIHPPEKYRHPKYHSWYAALIGCTLSHIKIIELARAQGLQSYVVLEDDATFSPHFHTAPGWGTLKPELILLGQNGIKNPRNKQLKGWVPAFELWGTHAYAVLTQNAMDLLHEKWSKMDFTTDVGWWELFEPLRAITYMPGLIQPSGSVSSIEILKHDAHTLGNKNV